MTDIVFEERAVSGDVVKLPTFGRDALIGVVTALAQPFGLSIPILSRTMMVLSIFVALLGLQQFGAVHRQAPRVDAARTVSGANVPQDAPFRRKVIAWEGQ